MQFDLLAFYSDSRMAKLQMVATCTLLLTASGICFHALTCDFPLLFLGPLRTLTIPTA